MVNFPFRHQWIYIYGFAMLFLGLLIFLIKLSIVERLGGLESFIFEDFIQSFILSGSFLSLCVYLDYKMITSLDSILYMKKHNIVRSVIKFSLLIIIAIFMVTIGNMLFFKSIAEFLSYIQNIAFDISVIASILMNIFLALIIEFFIQQNKMKQLEIENSHMKYIQLKEQINPHFLFNSLNVLIALINKNPDKASEYTRKLSHIYRYVLTHDNDKIVSLSEETEFIKNYIEIMVLRFGKGLQTSFNIKEKDLDRFVPPMCIQVLIENALKHNTVEPDNPLRITISSGEGYLEVCNNIIPRMQTVSETGIGLNYLKTKYQFLSNKEISIECGEKMFTVKLPLL